MQWQVYFILASCIEALQLHAAIINLQHLFLSLGQRLNHYIIEHNVSLIQLLPEA